jgi:AcrR family transcriptional regulator
MGRPLRKDALEHRRALLRAAAQVLAEQGLDAPLEAIAERAGVGRATLYRNFADRTALALAVLTQEVDDFADRTRARGDGADGFFRFLEDLADLGVRNAGFSSAVRMRAPDALAPLRARVMEAGRSPLRRSQDAGLVRKDLEPTDITVMASMLAVGLGGDEVERRAVNRRALDLLVHGLRARP